MKITTQLFMFNHIFYSICKTPLCDETHYDPSAGRHLVFFDKNMCANEGNVQHADRHVIKMTFRRDKMVDLHWKLRLTPYRRCKRACTFVITFLFIVCCLMIKTIDKIT